MTWVLILTLNFYHGGAALSVPFSDAAACAAALLKLKADLAPTEVRGACVQTKP